MKLPHREDIHSIIVRCPNWIGDAVMATPVFHQIRQVFPMARVTALAHEPIAQLLDGIEGIDEFLVFSREAGIKRREEQRVVKELRTRTIDLGILLTHSLSSAWMLWRGNVRWRLGMCAHFRRFLLNIPVRGEETQLHDVQSYCQLLRPFGVVETAPKLQLEIRREEQVAMEELLQHRGRRPGEKLIVMNPGAAYGSAKCWPQEYFRAVANALSMRRDLFCVFVGDRKAVSMIDGMMADLPRNVISLAGKTSLRDLMAVISLADCVVSNDSGPMHIAAAFQRPLIALFGSTNPRRTGPWGCGTVVYKQIACSPCYLRECPKDFRCMRSITPGEIIHHVNTLCGLC
jgi:heptosyltransferase-2